MSSKVSNLTEPSERRSLISSMSNVGLFRSSELMSMKVIHSEDEGSKHLQVYRGLRTQLLKFSGKKAFTCLVTSVASGGGSYVAVNLATTICLDRSKTSLLVDANLYSPYADCLLPVESQSGLTDFLEDDTLTVEDIVYASGIKRMRVVPVGKNKEGGTEKLHSARMRVLFNEIKSRYKDRYIIVDAPPISEYDADVSILADLCDLVVLVVPYGKVTETQLNSAIEKIGKGRLTGIVYNRC